MRALERHDVAALLAGARFAEVAVETSSGPHATPAAFAVAGDRVWVVSSRRSVRVRAIRRTGRAAVLVRSGERAVSISGEARVLSPWRRGEAAALLTGAAPAMQAATGYTLRNLRPVLAGFAWDLLTLSGDPTVYDRVLVSVRPDRGMVLDGPAVIDHWGRWSPQRAGVHTDGATTAAASTTPPPLDDILAGVPPAAAQALARRDTASLGWNSEAGPLLLPALALDGARGRVSASALALARGASCAPACLALHDSDGARPSSFRGVVLRGRGRVARRGPVWATVALSADRASWWVGFRTGTSRGTALRAA